MILSHSFIEDPIPFVFWERSMIMAVTATQRWRLATDLLNHSIGAIE